MIYIARESEKTVQKMLATKKVTILVGARQVGKTTLIEHLVAGKKATFLNLDLEVDVARVVGAAALASRDALRSLGSPTVLVIDEAQRLPTIGRIVKGWHDAKVSVHIVLLGSSSVHLLDQTAEALTGRNEKLTLPPLTFSEILRTASWYSPAYDRAALHRSFSSQCEGVIRRAMIFGSYPEAVTRTEGHEPYLMNLASDYILKDIFALGLVKRPDTIRRLLLLLAHQIGAEVSVAELAQTVGIARPTVERYMDLLERNFVIFRLPAFSTNPRKEIGKRHKVFFWDTGIRNALLKEFSQSPHRADLGALFENWVIAEFAKRNLLRGERQTLFFWRTIDGSEVDLIVKSGDRLQAFEIGLTKRKGVRPGFQRAHDVPVSVITLENAVEYLFD